ncbi:MAG: alpha-L-fucosidase [Bacteroidales bacterium]|nr:alpha-L-fucosidase [Bacteroidales bacterium]
MKRREMIKKATLLASTPLLLPGPFYGFGNSPGYTWSNEKVKRFGDSRDWFFEKRYGMFIHWGLYSIPAWHEQHQWRARVPRAEYVKLANQWNPKKFDPEEWLDTMEMAGMKYITITTKHHDGFCLWDTKQTKFNTMNTPYKQDIIGKLSDACHRRNVPLCLYYSIADWNHPNYPNQGRHHELAGPEPGDTPDWDKYMEFLKAQVKELCSNYGKIDGFWWDMNVPLYKDPSVNAMIRSLQPSAVINNRGFDDGDFGTPERDFAAAEADATVLERPTEACQSVGMESWGYKKDEDYYTDLHLERSIDKYLSRDANYLLNVGPTAEGLIPDQSYEILERLGEWYLSVEESFVNVTPVTQLLSSKDVFVTSRDKTIYIHFNKGLTGNGFKVKPLDVLPVKATLLNNNKRVECVVDLSPGDHIEQKKYLRLRNLPVNEMANSVMIIKLEFKNALS